MLSLFQGTPVGDAGCALKKRRGDMTKQRRRFSLGVLQSALAFWDALGVLLVSAAFSLVDPLGGIHGMSRHTALGRLRPKYKRHQTHSIGDLLKRPRTRVQREKSCPCCRCCNHQVRYKKSYKKPWFRPSSSLAHTTLHALSDSIL